MPPFSRRRADCGWGVKAQAIRRNRGGMASDSGPPRHTCVPTTPGARRPLDDRLFRAQPSPRKRRDAGLSPEDEADAEPARRQRAAPDSSASHKAGCGPGEPRETASSLGMPTRGQGSQGTSTTSSRALTHATCRYRYHDRALALDSASPPRQPHHMRSNENSTSRSPACRPFAGRQVSALSGDGRLAGERIRVDLGYWR
jgi:hypothetical protein